MAAPPPDSAVPLHTVRVGKAGAWVKNKTVTTALQRRGPGGVGGAATFLPQDRNRAPSQTPPFTTRPGRPAVAVVWGHLMPTLAQAHPPPWGGLLSNCRCLFHLWLPPGPSEDTLGDACPRRFWAAVVQAGCSSHPALSGLVSAGAFQPPLARGPGWGHGLPARFSPACGSNSQAARSAAVWDPRAGFSSGP